MSQNSVIFAALVIGFIVYITIKGRLSAYLALFWTKQQSSPQQAPGSGPVTLQGPNGPYQVSPGAMPNPGIFTQAPPGPG